MSKFKSIFGSSLVAGGMIMLSLPAAAQYILPKVRNACIVRTAEEMGVAVRNISVAEVGRVNPENGVRTLFMRNIQSGRMAECRVNTIDGYVLSVKLTGGNNNVGRTPRLLGTTYLSPINGDRDLLSLSECNLREIQIRPIDRNIDVEEFWVSYGDGSKQSFKVRAKINAGQTTRWIDFQGNRRCLKQISITGDAADGSIRRAKVEFWGR